jgi:hypothetical protein
MSNGGLSDFPCSLPSVNLERCADLSAQAAFIRLGQTPLVIENRPAIDELPRAVRDPLVLWTRTWVQWLAHGLELLK